MCGMGDPLLACLMVRAFVPPVPAFVVLELCLTITLPTQRHPLPLKGSPGTLPTGIHFDGVLYKYAKLQCLYNIVYLRLYHGIILVK